MHTLGYPTEVEAAQNLCLLRVLGFARTPVVLSKLVVFVPSSCILFAIDVFFSGCV